MGFRRDTDRPGSWNDLVAENIFGFGVEFVSMLVYDFEVAGVLLGTNELANEAANGRFDEIGTIFEGMGELIHGNKQFFR
jgi:hypothetical protein